MRRPVLAPTGLLVRLSRVSLRPITLNATLYECKDGAKMSTESRLEKRGRPQPNRQLWSLFLATAAFFVTAACSLLPVGSDREFPIALTPCAPPCWQGITPYETSEEEAFDILQGLSFVDPATVKLEHQRWKRTGSDDQAVLSWHSRTDFDERGYGRLKVEDRVVVFISVSTGKIAPLEKILLAKSPQSSAASPENCERRTACL